MVNSTIVANLDGIVVETVECLVSDISSATVIPAVPLKQLLHPGISLAVILSL